MRPLAVTLYGQFVGHWSNAGVSRGLAAGLHANGVALKLVGEQGLYENMWTLPRRVSTRAPEPQLCAGVPQTEGIGMYVGYPLARAAQALVGHPIKVGAFICESEVLPPDWSVVARSCDLVVTPSRWVRDAYTRAGVLPENTIVIPHGLHPTYRTPVSPVDRHLHDGLPFLHISGARDFIERKGTPQLIEAFAKVFDPTRGTLRHQKALLVIRTPSGGPADALVEATKQTGCPFLYHFDWHDSAMSPEHMKDYLSGEWAAVVQPSRAEAFGICGVEARAMGLPVILTGCSGHAAHTEPSDIVIAHGPVSPIRVQGIPNGSAPTVTADAIAEALRTFTLKVDEHRKAALSRALGYWARYDWGRVTEPLAVRLRELTRHAGGRSLAGRMLG